MKRRILATVYSLNTRDHLCRLECGHIVSLREVPGQPLITLSYDCSACGPEDRGVRSGRELMTV